MTFRRQLSVINNWLLMMHAPQKIANFATKRKLIIEFSNNLSTIIKNNNAYEKTFTHFDSGIDGCHDQFCICSR